MNRPSRCSWRPTRLEDEGPRGRRIEEVEGGWRLLNHALYRERASADEQREKSRLRMAAKRARDAAKEQPVTPPVTQSSECHAPSPKVRHAEAEAEAEREQIQSERGATPTPRDSLARAVRVGFVERFERKHATTHEGPKGGDLAKILDAAEADRDPEGFVVAALDGFFASARMASQHPPHPVRFLAADIASWAADGRRHAPATPLHPDEAARRAKAEVDAANADWARRVGA